MFIGDTKSIIIENMIEIDNSDRSEAHCLYKQVEKALIQNREGELFFKAFLKPVQIALKTAETQKDLSRQGSMPYGLKQVVRAAPGQNRFLLENFQSIDTKLPKINQTNGCTFQQLKDSKCGNLLSLLKPSSLNRGIKVAICICMYSEDKTMLKRTLSGVSQNIQTFVSQGYSQNQIAVIVVMDGILPVHTSVLQLFEQIQKELNIYMNDDTEPVNKNDMLQENQLEEDEQVNNFNHLTFNPEEYLQYKRDRFVEIHKQYKKYLEMIVNIQKLQKTKNLDYDSLDDITKKFFIQKAKEQYKRQYAFSDDEIKLVKESVILQRYAENKKTRAPLIKQALNEAKAFCQEYITTRNSLAVMSSFRMPITLANPMKDSKGDQTNSYLEIQNQQKEKIVNMNLFLVTKYKNAGKLSSHNWFFNGFCVELNPKYAILLDVGLVPEKGSLWKMCDYMEKKQKVGGVCGYMGLRIQKMQDNQEINDESVDCITRFALKLFDIQRAQQFQYHFAHLIDKPFESSFGFIHVLPGAFSGYRMDALRKAGHHDSQILKNYFKSIEASSGNNQYTSQSFGFCKTISKVLMPDFLFNCCYGSPGSNSYERLLYDENVYLAEDRTLCMGIHQNGYTLSYLPDAGAWVDPMKTLYGMLGQRKRWINGSYFAFQKVKSDMKNNQQEQGESAACCLTLQMMYLSFMNMLGFIAPALFLYTIHITMYTLQTNVIVTILQNLGILSNNNAVTSNNVVGILVYIVDLIYVLIFLGLVFYSMHLTNREPRFRTYFYGVSTIYGVFSISVFSVLLFDIISGFNSSKPAFLIENPGFVQSILGGQSMITSLRWIMLAIIGLYIVPVIVSLCSCKFKSVVEIVLSTLSFVFYSPTYLNILNIYALCRMDDISWGTKGLEADSTNRKADMADEWKKIKFLHVGKFVVYNLVVGFLLLLFGDNYVIRFWFTFVMMVIIFGTLFFKVLIGFIFSLWYLCIQKKKIEGTVPAEIPDNVWDKFSKLKVSMYKDIKDNIVGIEKQLPNSDPKNRDNLMRSIVMSSKIFCHLKPRTNQIKYKRNTNFEISQRFDQQSVSKFINKNPLPQIKQVDADKEIGKPSKKNTKIEQQQKPISEEHLSNQSYQNYENVVIAQQNKKPLKYKKDQPRIK